MKLQRHSSLWLCCSVGACLALLLAAWAGARWQAARMAPLAVEQHQILDARQLESAQVRGSLTGLADTLGMLQGRVLALEALRARLVEEAGLRYTAPELARPAEAGHPKINALPLSVPADPQIGAAESLGRRIDDLGQRLSRQEDAFALADLALSQQAGLRASLPTLMPVIASNVSSPFGWRRNPVSGHHVMHEGIDFAAPRGTPVRAASGGVVVRAGSVPGYGRMVEIDHGNGLRTRYAHASRLLVKAGDIVQQGDLVARVGSTGRSTGSHLHFEVRVADYPLDPTLFIRSTAPMRLAGDGGPVAGAAGSVHAGG